MGWKHTNHLLAREGRVSVKVNQVHGDMIWGVVNNVRGFTVTDIGAVLPRAPLQMWKRVNSPKVRSSCCGGSL